MTWALKHDDGTYYQGRSVIGPMFGGTVEEAKRFQRRDMRVTDGQHAKAVYAAAVRRGMPPSGAQEPHREKPPTL